MMTTAELRDPPWPKSYIFKDFAHAKGCSIGTAHPLFPSTACTYTFLGKGISQMEKKTPCQVDGLCDRGDAREPGGGRGGAATKQSQGVGCSRLKSVSEQGVHSRRALLEDPWFRRSLLRKKNNYCAWAELKQPEHLRCFIPAGGAHFVRTEGAGVGSEALPEEDAEHARSWCWPGCRSSSWAVGALLTLVTPLHRVSGPK